MAPNASPGSATPATPSRAWFHWDASVASPAGTAVVQEHRAGPVVSADLLPGSTDRQVGVAVAVEVAGRKRRAEQVTVLRRIGADLLEQLLAVGHEALVAAEQDLDAAGVQALDRVAGNADGEVVEAVVVEVASRPRLAEAVACGRRAGDARGAL